MVINNLPNIRKQGILYIPNTYLVGMRESLNYSSPVLL